MRKFMNETRAASCSCVSRTQKAKAVYHQELENKISNWLDATLEVEFHYISILLTSMGMTNQEIIINM